MLCVEPVGARSRRSQRSRSSPPAARPVRADATRRGRGVARAARQPTAPAARRTLGRRPARAVPRRSRPPGRGTATERADARLDGDRPCRPAAGDRRALVARRARRPRAVVRPGAERLRRARSTRCCFPRSSATVPSRASTRCAPPIRPQYRSRRSTQRRSASASGRRVGFELPGFDGTGVTVALLDTGVDLRHPFLQGRLLPGIDILDADGDPSAAQNPTEPGRPERHGTGLAGLVAGVRGPAGLHGVAPGRVGAADPRRGLAAGRRRQRLRLRPHRPGARRARGCRRPERRRRRARRARGSRSSASSSRSPPSRTARWPRAAAARSPSARSSSSPAGNDGPAGPGYGSIAAPAGTSGVLGVAASDSRGRSPTVHVLLRAGLRVLASGETALGGAAGPDDVVSAPVVALPRRQVVAVTRGNALDRLFDDDGYSRVAGGAVLLPSGPTTPGGSPRVRLGRRARGARRRTDPRGVARHRRADRGADRRRLRRSRRRGAAFASRQASPSSSASAPRRSGATRSSEPLRRSRAPGSRSTAEPARSSTAPGVGLVTAVPGRNEGGAARYGTLSGSSAAAAVVAGSAALLAQARPDLDAAGLRCALVATSRPRPGTAGEGVVDPAAASSVELVADPPVAALGALVGRAIA